MCRARKPFHPAKLWDFVNKYFHVQQPTMHGHTEECEDVRDSDVAPEDEAEMTIVEDTPDVTVLAAKQNDLHATFGQVSSA